jgi:hypothetical protein
MAGAALVALALIIYGSYCIWSLENLVLRLQSIIAMELKTGWFLWCITGIMGLKSVHHDLVHCALPGSHGKRLVIEELQVSQCVWLEHWASQHIDGLPQPQCNGQNTGSHNVLLEHVAGLIVYVCNTRSHYGIVWLWLDPWVCWCIMMARTSVS